MRSRRGGTIPRLAIVLCVFAAACAGDGDDEPAVEVIADEPTSTTTEAPAPTDAADETPTSSVPEAADEEPPPNPPAEGQGLTVIIQGDLVDGLLCPGGARPCLEFVGDLGTAGTVRVQGRLFERLLWVDEQLEVPPAFVVPDYSNRCPDQDLGPVEAYETLEPMLAGDAPQPAGFVDIWDSTDAVLHIGVSGDPTAVEAYLAANGLAGQLCVVTGFPYPLSVLRSAQRAAVDGAVELGYSGLSASYDIWEGAVDLHVTRFDQALRTFLAEVSAAHEGVSMVVTGSIEVVDGTLDDYQYELFAAGRNPDPADLLRVTCGSVVFDTLPPDVDGFPPLDADGLAALDVFINGETSEIAPSFVDGVEWSQANQTEDSLVLFGQQTHAGGVSYTSIPFVLDDGEWRVAGGFGGCRIMVDAPGLGPAEVALDPSRPIDPTSSELPLHIFEQACAGGAPPTDREVVPVVIETDESVTVIVLVAPVEGGATCPGNPPHPITVTLDAPLGDRALLDGHVQPAVPVE